MTDTTKPATGSKPAAGLKGATELDLNIAQPPCICNGKCEVCKCRELQEVSR